MMVLHLPFRAVRKRRVREDDLHAIWFIFCFLVYGMKHGRRCFENNLELWLAKA